jgi:hypothetical protein
MSRAAIDNPSLGPLGFSFLYRLPTAVAVLYPPAMKADFTRYLAPMADQLICVQDDIEAQGIALVCGLIGQFKSGENTPRVGGWVHALPFKEHPTHWVFVMKYTNFPLPADNGWSAIFYPKSKTTFAEAEAELRKVP